MHAYMLDATLLHQPFLCLSMTRFYLLFVFVFRPDFCFGWYSGPPTVSLSIRRNASILLGSLDPSALEISKDADPLGHSEEEETIRVKIWRALADGEERTLQELGRAIGHHRDLRSHLKHVARQAETLRNKPNAWRERRGLPADANDIPRIDKIRLTMRNGKRRNETFVRLD